MIAVDTSVLIYANRSDSPFHRVARSRLAALAEGPAPWGLPVAAAWGFARVVTQRAFDPPTTVSQAMDALAALTSSPSVRILNPGRRHWSLLTEIVQENQVRGALMTDAVIVALCREHGVDTILTNDRDFRRFSGIRVEILAS